MLLRFWTGIAIREEGLAGRFFGALPDGVKVRFSGRLVRGVPASRMRSRYLADLRAQVKLSRGLDPELAMRERNASFQRSIPQSDLALCDVAIGFDTSSWILGERAKNEGKRFVLDQTTTHAASKEVALALARDQYPDWKEDLAPRKKSVAAEEYREQELADCIVVASSFARATMIAGGVHPQKLVVIPYGVDLEHFRPAAFREKGGKKRFLFLGSVNARKGVPLLLDAWRELEPVASELVIAGEVSRGVQSLLNTPENVRFLGRVSKDAIPELMRSCHVLVLPSYFEGFGMVLLEALASGLPIVASDTSAAPDLLSEGQGGIVFRSGDLKGLRDALQRLLESPDLLRGMGAVARQIAECHSWDAYGDRWVTLLESWR